MNLLKTFLFLLRFFWSFFLLLFFGKELFLWSLNFHLSSETFLKHSKGRCYSLAVLKDKFLPGVESRHISYSGKNRGEIKWQLGDGFIQDVEIWVFETNKTLSFPVVTYGLCPWKGSSWDCSLSTCSLSTSAPLGRVKMWNWCVYVFYEFSKYYLIQPELVGCLALNCITEVELDKNMNIKLQAAQLKLKRLEKQWSWFEGKVGG